MVNFFLGISKPLCKLTGFEISYATGFFQGSTWRKSKAGAVLPANLCYDGSRSLKTKGSLADTFQCNIWRRAQTPHRRNHCMHGGDNHSKHNGFTALGKTIGTSKSTESDSNRLKVTQNVPCANKTKPQQNDVRICANGLQTLYNVCSNLHGLL